MPNKKNDIIEEQKKAREEFLKLKKMQNGEIEAPPKPSEIAIAPKTFEEKRANFWYHYKWHTIIILFITVILTIFFTQCSAREKYDFKIIFFTYNAFLDTQLEPMEEYFEKYANDINNDGEINVKFINCSLSEKSTDTVYKNNIYRNLQTLMLGENTSLLYITDPKSIDYFKTFDKSGGFFEANPQPLPNDFYKNLYVLESSDFEKNLTISCRKIKGTILENQKDIQKNYEDSLKLIETLSKQ